MSNDPARPVLLPAHAVEALRERIGRCTDPAASTTSRNAEQAMLVGALMFWLDDRQALDDRQDDAAVDSDDAYLDRIARGAPVAAVRQLDARLGDLLAAWVADCAREDR